MDTVPTFPSLTATSTSFRSALPSQPSLPERRLGLVLDDEPNADSHIYAEVYDVPNTDSDIYAEIYDVPSSPDTKLGHYDAPPLPVKKQGHYNVPTRTKTASFNDMENEKESHEEVDFPSTTNKLVSNMQTFFYASLYLYMRVCPSVCP